MARTWELVPMFVAPLTKDALLEALRRAEVALMLSGGDVPCDLCGSSDEAEHIGTYIFQLANAVEQTKGPIG